MVADHIAAQRKLTVEILPVRRAVDSVQAVLNALEGLDADDWLVMALAHGDAPARGFHKTGIGALGEDLRHAHVPHDTAAIPREGGVVLEKAHHIRLRIEASRGIAFERFLHGSRRRLVTTEHHAPPCNALELVADRRLENPITVHHAGAHPVFGLLAVLLALVLGHAREEVFDKDGVGVFPEFDGRRFQLASCAGDQAAQFKVRL